VEINVPECGIEGMADVLGVQPGPEVTPGPGRVVTATFHHEAARTVDLTIEGLDEPIHGAAPDISGQGVANPLATILSAALMLRYSLDAPELADRIETAVGRVLDDGLRTPDIESPGTTVVGTREMGDAVGASLARG